MANDIYGVLERGFDLGLSVAFVRFALITRLAEDAYFSMPVRRNSSCRIRILYCNARITV